MSARHETMNVELKGLALPPETSVALAVKVTLLRLFIYEMVRWVVCGGEKCL
jgi:hypothetical protein